MKLRHARPLQTYSFLLIILLLHYRKIWPLCVYINIYARQQYPFHLKWTDWSKAITKLTMLLCALLLQNQQVPIEDFWRGGSYHRYETLMPTPDYVVGSRSSVAAYNTTRRNPRTFLCHYIKMDCQDMVTAIYSASLIPVHVMCWTGLRVSTCCSNLWSDIMLPYLLICSCLEWLLHEWW